VFVRFLDWRYTQSSWYFRPSFVNCCPSPLLSGSNLPPFPVWISILVYTYTVCKEGGCMYGVLGLIQMHLPQSSFTGRFFRWRHFAFYESYLFKAPPLVSEATSHMSCFPLPQSNDSPIVFCIRSDRALWGKHGMCDPYHTAVTQRNSEKYCPPLCIKVKSAVLRSESSCVYINYSIEKGWKFASQNVYDLRAQFRHSC
jgi:hypothetical protein